MRDDHIDDEVVNGLEQAPGRAERGTQSQSFIWSRGLCSPRGGSATRARKSPPWALVGRAEADGIMAMAMGLSAWGIN